MNSGDRPVAITAMTGVSNGRGIVTVTAHSQTLTYPKFGEECTSMLT